MFLLQPLWQAHGNWAALLAHCPLNAMAPLAIALADSPLASLRCYCPCPSGELPVDLPWPHTLYAVKLSPEPATDPLTPQLINAEETPPAGPFVIQGVSKIQQVNQLAQHDTLFCGSWFTAPLPQSATNPSQPMLLELLSMIVRDADSAELEKVFAKAPQLTINLLRLVNSVGSGSLRIIESIRQAIAILGRRQLQRWLQLLLYAEQFAQHGQFPPLFVAAALRAKRMEEWAHAGWISESSPDAAFMAGMLSLLDRLFGQDLEKLLSPLPLPPAMQEGLLHQQGEIGRAIHWLELAEAGKVSQLEEHVQHCVDDQQRWMQAEIRSLAWVHELMGNPA